MVCGAAVDEITTQPTFPVGGVQIDLCQSQNASITPVKISGEEYAREEV